jgi:hypothetical protein
MKILLQRLNEKIAANYGLRSNDLKMKRTVIGGGKLIPLNET